MLGYLNNPIATSDTFTPGGWISSGDIGFVRDGTWYVTDRNKDIIKVRGWQVSPTELESVLLQHDDIVDAGVIGVQLSKAPEEVPRAFVVRRPGSTVTEYDARSWMSERLARYKQVDRVIFLKEIPRNPAGKIVRRFLKDGMYKEEDASAGAELIEAEEPEAAHRELETIGGVCDDSLTVEDHSALAHIIDLYVTEDEL